jgi:hypothetical protein
MNAPSAYFGGRTSMGSDSRRSLIRVRQQQQQEEEKNAKKINKSKQSPASVKQRVYFYKLNFFQISFLFFSLVKVMNLVLLLTLNKLLLQKKLHQNLLQLLRIEKVQIKTNHRMFYHLVHPNPKVNLKVKHPMINQVILHHQIIIKQKLKHFRQQHQKNHRYHHQQFLKNPIKYLPPHQQQKLI